MFITHFVLISGHNRFYICFPLCTVSYICVHPNMWIDACKIIIIWILVRTTTRKIDPNPFTKVPGVVLIQDSCTICHMLRSSNSGDIYNAF